MNSYSFFLYVRSVFVFLKQHGMFGSLCLINEKQNNSYILGVIPQYMLCLSFESTSIRVFVFSLGSLTILFIVHFEGRCRSTK